MSQSVMRQNISTIKVYLSAIRHLPICCRPPKAPVCIAGSQRAEAQKGVGKCARLPISPDIPRMLKTVWDTEPLLGATMLWAACCLGFFGFLRSERWLSLLKVSMTLELTCQYRGHSSGWPSLAKGSEGLYQTIEEGPISKDNIYVSGKNTIRHLPSEGPC